MINNYSIKPSVLPYNYLLIGGISYLVIVICNMLGDISSVVPEFVYSAFIVSFLLSHLFFFKAFTERKIAGSIDQVFTFVVVGGLIVLFFSLIVDLIGIGLGKISQSIHLQLFQELVSYYLTVFYLLFTLFLFKQYLFFFHRNRSAVVSFQAFLVLLIIGALMGFQGYDFPLWFSQIILFIGVILSFILNTRIKWIAFLDRKEQILCIGLLAIIALTLVGLYQQFSQSNLPYLISEPLHQNVFVLLLFISVGSYSIFSLLALLFNLPISSVKRERESEIESYDEMSRRALGKEDPDSIYRLMFDVCVKNTNSDGGWLYLDEVTRKVSSNIGSGKYEFIGITKQDAFYMGTQVRFEEDLRKSPSKDHFYYPNLGRLKVGERGRLVYKSLLVFPITSNDNLRGHIGLVKRYEEGFDEYLINLSRSYINQGRVANQSAQLLQSAIENARFKEQLDIAKDVQTSLLPQNFPDSPYIDVATSIDFAQEVGGDYYDYNFISEDVIAFVIGDVSGKGTAAAFHMAQMKGIFHALIQLCLPADNFMVMANEALRNCLIKRGLFITLTYVSFDFKARKAIYSRAGHCPLLVYSASKKEAFYLEKGGIGLGIVGGSSFINNVSVEEYEIDEGDIVVLYTDGISEGRSDNTEEMFGYDRMRDILEKNHYLSAQVIKNAIYEEFRYFTNDNSQGDDASLVIIKINSLKKN